MRLLIVMLAALVIALPAAASAQSATRAGSTVATQAAKKKKAKAVKKLERKATATKAARKATTTKAARKASKQAAARQRSAGKAASSASTSGEREAKGPLVLGTGTVSVGTLECAVPAGTSLAGFAAGDMVELECTLVGGVLTLSKLSLEDDANGQGESEVKGVITALAAGSITVGSTTCAVPAGVSLAGFTVGAFVEMECDLVGGVPTLSKLKLEDDESATGDDDDSGSGSADDDDDNSGSGSSSSGSDDDDDESDD
jgi:hypothetical protein